MSTSTVILQGPDHCPVELHNRVEITQDIMWQARLQSWQGCSVQSLCCGGQHKLVVFREPETGLLSLRAHPGTRDRHLADCPAVGAPTPSEEGSCSAQTFAELANRALDLAYLRWWQSGDGNTEIGPTLVSEFGRLQPEGSAFRVAVVDRDTTPTMGSQHYFEFPVIEYPEGSLQYWRAWAYGNRVSGRHENLGRPIRSDYLALAEIDADEAIESRFIAQVHCWPLVRTRQGSHVVQSAAEADYAAILSEKTARFLKPPSTRFLRLLAEANTELSQLAHLCAEYHIWPDYLLPGGEVGHVIDLLGLTDLDYIRRALEKFELYRRLERKCGLRWHAVAPAPNGGFQTIAGSDDHFAGILL